MRILLSLSLLLALLYNSNAQYNDKNIYDPTTDAKKQIESAVNLAQEENKHVLLQVGGNWCPWCIKLHQFINDHELLDSLIKTDYVFELVNYNKENKNMDIMAELGYPQRFGFPVLVILDRTGNHIHTQNTVYLEEDKSYSEKKIIAFLQNWNVKATDPSSYSK